MTAVQTTLGVPAADPGHDLMAGAWRTTAALGVVLALLVGLLWLLRKSTGARRGGRGLAVEAALSLGERRSLAIVVVEGRRLLLGLGPGQVSLVTELRPHEAFSDAVDRAMDPGGRS